MIKRFFNFFKREKPVEPEVKTKRVSFFSSDELHLSQMEHLETYYQNTFQDVKPFVNLSPQATSTTSTPKGTMDAQTNVKGKYGFNAPLPPAQLLWYASQTFIGYQTCAMLAQNWLISKCCLMPAKDATRNGYKITTNDGQAKITPEILEAMRVADVDFRLNDNLIELVHMGRVFGIRIAMFIIDIPDCDTFYANPFNPDAVTPGSYKGISQIDPYWITPQLDAVASGQPMSINFYEPTWWIVGGKAIHRSHLIIFRTEEVADILKPTYIFGGIPIPQKIAERVFASEKTANEAPQLALTKRTDVVKIDLAAATADEVKFASRMEKWAYIRNNFGMKFLDHSDDMMQFDTSLADLDAVIMTQYQLVAAAANVPAVKLLGTSPKGFNATGEFEEANYHEELESIQTHDLTPLIQRHHLLLIRSQIAPQFNIQPFDTCVEWNELDAMTAKEQAEVNRLEAETGAILVNSGAIDAEDERNRIIANPHSGYTGMTEEELLSDPEGS